MTTFEHKWVACAMSGGVDSSVTAALLQEQGHHVIGVTMQLRPDEDDVCERACCSLTEAEDARRVAARLGIPHYILDFQELFRRAVIDDFIDEYRAGRTPNPCIQCNTRLKFDALRAYVRTLGAEYIATGHYARVVYHDAVGRWSIRRGIDRSKDQSYALYGLTQEQLAHTLLPLGALEKTRTREIARDLGLRVAEKPDSQDICFVPEGDYGQFLRAEAPEALRPGTIVDRDGTVLGAHDGVALYTIGQRKRLGISTREPRYVTRLDAAAGRVHVGTADDLLSRTVVADQVVFGKYAAGAFAAPRPVTAMLRYKMAAQPAVACLVDGRLHVTFDTPQRAVTPGQMLVCYEGDDVVCGGRILDAARFA